jgi:hypothetical protein
VPPSVLSKFMSRPGFIHKSYSTVEGSRTVYCRNKSRASESSMSSESNESVSHAQFNHRKSCSHTLQDCVWLIPHCIFSYDNPVGNLNGSSTK